MPRMLIIDDDELITGALLQRLKETGVATDLATNPADADAMLSANEYALVLLDAYLTGQTTNRAFQLIDCVRNRRQSARVVLLTAYESPALHARLREDDQISVVAKPKPVPYLAALINGFLNTNPGDALSGV
jgi:DNA-binding NtrC family response regulator